MKKNSEVKKNKKISSNNNLKNNNNKNDENNFLTKILSILKSFFSEKRNIIITIIVAIIIIGLILIIVFHKKDNRFALNEIYDIYPGEVRKLYSNIVEIPCTGDLHLDDITINAEQTSIDDINKNNLLDYLFSNIDKNEGLNDKMEISLIKKRQKELFNTNLDLTETINNYQYGEYLYTIEGNKVTRKAAECKNDIKYVTFLYGYSWNNNLLSMDVNISYLKDGILYDLADNKLGSYNGDVSKLFSLTKTTSYYKFNYVKKSGDFKLDSVRWMNRS